MVLTEGPTRSLPSCDLLQPSSCKLRSHLFGTILERLIAIDLIPLGKLQIKCFTYNITASTEDESVDYGWAFFKRPTNISVVISVPRVT